MPVDHTAPTFPGGHFIMNVRDRTDTGNDVQVQVGDADPVGDMTISWAYSIDGVMSGWSNYTLSIHDGAFHTIANVVVGYANEFIFHIAANGNPLIGGPADLVVAPLLKFASFKKVKFKDGATWKDALPMVKSAGVWRAAQPYIKVAGDWKTI